jgi:hypothetical protein
MEEPKSPKAWANFLVTAWGERLPIKVKIIALEYSNRFPDPLKDIVPASVGAAFEGALYPLRNSGKWAILYNPHIREPGRINFTLGHEFGHYLNHRSLQPDGFECSDQAVLGYDLDAHRRKLEQEADEFASYLLMPMNDYRAQIRGQQMTLDLLSHCANRYEVSATAAALKWLRFTEDRAVLLYARDGHVLWGQRSDPAKKMGIYFPAGMELPAASIAARRPAAQSTPAGVELAEGIWSPTERVREMSIFADHYHATISLLVWPKVPPPIRFGTGEQHVEDTFDRLKRHR